MKNQHFKLTPIAAAIALHTSALAAATVTIPDGTNVNTASQAPGETITVDQGSTVTVNGASAVTIDDPDVVLNNDGAINSDMTAVDVASGGDNATINNGPNSPGALISGAVNGVRFAADVDGGTVVNNGTISSASRAIDIQGDNITVTNNSGGSIEGLGDQRNGTIYTNDTANNFAINNDGTIDAGTGNSGAGISVSLDANAPTTGSITNTGTIQGRGQASAGAPTAGDGIRLETVRAAGALGANSGTFTGTITNSGTIDSESTQGTTAGIRTVNGVSFQGTLNNQTGGTISGAQNGLYFGNAVPAGGADHTGGVVNNEGTISSDSRALNIDGTGLVVNNSGSIIGTGNQRNGTAYADSTAQNFTLNNQVGGTIDAGAGNEGAGFSTELSEAGNNFTIDNDGTIQGRGNAGAGLATAGDGIRLERTRVAGALDGTTTGLFTGTITNSGTISSEGANGTVAGFRAVNGVSFQGTLTNEAGGVISGVQNGVYFGNPTPAGGGDHTGGVVNNAGTISSDSRALNIDGTGLVVNNSGSIIGTGNQRNGTAYADSTAQNFTLNNQTGGVIDAGAGNEGAGFSTELSEAGNNFTIDNDGTIAGRGNAGAGLATAGDGIRLERTRVAGALDGTTTGLFTGTINNSGTISSEGANGTVGGFRAVNGVSFQGTLNNEAGGTISGTQNGVYFGNAVPAGGADHTGGVVNNAGTISSDSRALNIDGTGLVVNNSGSIIGTGNQRNGTAYADSTAQNFTLNNQTSGVIDAGAGNEGAGFSTELSEAGNNFTIDNDGTIAGRGNAGAGLATAGDGIRLERTRVAGALDGTTTGLFTGTINNSGTISSEGANGTVGGFRAVNGVSFQGTLNNEAGGTISGTQNGVYFGNAVPAGGADHTGGVVNNAGTISSDSRALNIDGTGLVVNNSGSIIGTGNQRNGTAYADSTAQNFTLNNQTGGVIDAGAGNEGAGFSTELSEAGNNFTITNAGTIAGRGNAGAGLATAGDGIRLERTRVGGALDGTTTGLFTGTITNSGTISSEGANGTVAGFRTVNGVSFQGTLNNEEGGVISGEQNGVYFGNAVPAGGADHTGGVVNNSGTISSGSRALNIDGNGLTINNSGSILGTGNQRNGTVYQDGTGDNATINNLASGVIDAGAGNIGSGISIQVGTTDGDSRTGSITNAGTINGRGDALPSGAAAAIRLFNGAGTGTVSYNGDISNSGTVSAEQAPAILIEDGVAFTGTLSNSGQINSASGVAIDVSATTNGVTIEQNTGDINGDILLGQGNDTVNVFGGTIGGQVLGQGSGVVNVNVGLGNRFVSNGVFNVQDFNILSGTVDQVGDFSTAGTTTTIASGATLSFSNPVNGSGALVNNGNLEFVIGQNSVGSLNQTGVVTLNDGSTITVSGTGGAAVLGTQNLLTATDIVDNGVTIIDNNPLLDFASQLNGGLLSITTEVSDLGAPSVSGAVTQGAREANYATLRLISDRLTGAEAFGLVEDKHNGFWLQGFGGQVNQDEDDGIDGYEADTEGFAIGYDRAFGDWRVGAAYSYGEVDADDDRASNDSTDIESDQFSLYANYRTSNWFANAIVSYADLDYDLERNVDGVRIEGDTEGDLLSFKTAVGANYQVGGLTLTPVASLTYSQLEIDRYTEQGGLDLTVNYDDVDELESELGLTASKQFQHGNWTISPSARVSWHHEFLDEETEVDASFAGGSFSQRGADTDQDQLGAGLGINFKHKSGLSVSLDYDSRFGSDFDSQTGSLNLRYNF